MQQVIKINKLFSIALGDFSTGFIGRAAPDFSISVVGKTMGLQTYLTFNVVDCTVEYREYLLERLIAGTFDRRYWANIILSKLAEYTLDSANDFKLRLATPIGYITDEWELWEPDQRAVKGLYSSIGWVLKRSQAVHWSRDYSYEMNERIEIHGVDNMELVETPYDPDHHSTVHTTSLGALVNESALLMVDDLGSIYGYRFSGLIKHLPVKAASCVRRLIDEANVVGCVAAHRLGEPDGGKRGVILDLTSEKIAALAARTAGALLDIDAIVGQAKVEGLMVQEWGGLCFITDYLHNRPYEPTGCRPEPTRHASPWW